VKNTVKNDENMSQTSALTAIEHKKESYSNAYRSKVWNRVFFILFYETVQHQFKKRDIFRYYIRSLTEHKNII
jgi:hypothetical protein